MHAGCLGSNTSPPPWSPLRCPLRHVRCAFDLLRRLRHWLADGGTHPASHCAKILSAGPDPEQIQMSEQIRIGGQIQSSGKVQISGQIQIEISGQIQMNDQIKVAARVNIPQYRPWSDWLATAIRKFYTAVVYRTHALPTEVACVAKSCVVWVVLADVFDGLQRRNRHFDVRVLMRWLKNCSGEATCSFVFCVVQTG